jgi:ribose transport system substrate-binding protein
LLEAGATKAGQEFGVAVDFKTPSKQKEIEAQAVLVDESVKGAVDGLVVAPVEDQKLSRAVLAAIRKKVPVVVVDFPGKGEAGIDYTASIGTIPSAAGLKAAETLVKLMAGQGKILLFRDPKPDLRSKEHEGGFLDSIRRQMNIQLLADNHFGGLSVEEAEREALNLSESIREASGIFCSTPASTLGMVKAMRQLGLVGIAKVVGYGHNPELLDALRRGEIDALLVENPRAMGYDAVKFLASQWKGQKPSSRWDTAVEVVTKANLDSVATKALLNVE